MLRFVLETSGWIASPTLFTIGVRSIAAASLLCFCGCADDGLAPLYGKVFVDGAAAPMGVSLDFIPTDKSLLPCTAETNEQGDFVAQFTFRKRGVQPGEYTARLTPGSIFPAQSSPDQQESGRTDAGETPKPDGKSRTLPRRPTRQSNGLPKKYYEKIETFFVDENGLKIDFHLETE